MDSTEFNTTWFLDMVKAFSTKRNFPCAAQFFFVFFLLVLPESSQTKKNCAARGKLRLVENGLNMYFLLTKEIYSVEFIKAWFCPLLFFMYIVDLSNYLESTVPCLFVDDIQILASSHDTNELIHKSNSDLVN